MNKEKANQLVVYNTLSDLKSGLNPCIPACGDVRVRPTVYSDIH